jgi:hypothetical protein
LPPTEIRGFFAYRHTSSISFSGIFELSILDAIRQQVPARYGMLSLFGRPRLTKADTVENVCANAMINMEREQRRFIVDFGWFLISLMVYGSCWIADCSIGSRWFRADDDNEFEILEHWCDCRKQRCRAFITFFWWVAGSMITTAWSSFDGRRFDRYERKTSWCREPKSRNLIMMFSSKSCWELLRWIKQLEQTQRSFILTSSHSNRFQ